MNLLRIILVVLVCVQANAANVRLGFRDNAGEIDTNALLVTKISTNILADGGVLAQGIPRRLPYSPITNTLSIGRYSVSNLHLRSWVVIEVGDSSSTLYDMTNLLVSGANTYVMRSLNINELTNTPGMLALLTNIASSAGGGAAVSAAELAVPSTNGGVVTITVPTNAVQQLTVAGSTNSVNATNLYPAAPLSVDFLGGTLTSGNSTLGPSGLAVNGGGALKPSGFEGNAAGLTNLPASALTGTASINTTGNAAGASNLYGAALSLVTTNVDYRVTNNNAVFFPNLQLDYIYPANPAVNPLPDIYALTEYGSNRVTESDVIRYVQQIYTNGYNAFGLTGILLDAGWAARDGNGKLIVKPAVFTNDLKYICDYAHARGVKIGVYYSVLTNSGWNPFDQVNMHTNMLADIQVLVTNGVDWIKIDSGAAPRNDQNSIAFWNAVAKTGANIHRQMSIDEYGNTGNFYALSPGLASGLHSAYVGLGLPDTSDVPLRMTNSYAHFLRSLAARQYVGPAFKLEGTAWLKNGIRNQYSYPEHCYIDMAMMTAERVMVVPEVGSMSLTNRWLWDLYQAPVTVADRVLTNGADLICSRRIGPAADGVRAVCFINPAATNKTMTVNLHDLGFRTNDIVTYFSPWFFNSLEGWATNTVSVTVPPTNTVLYKMVSGYKSQISEGVTYLSDLMWASTANIPRGPSYAPEYTYMLSKDSRNGEGASNPLTINSTTYAKGFCAGAYWMGSTNPSWEINIGATTTNAYLSLAFGKQQAWNGGSTGLRLTIYTNGVSATVSRFVTNNTTQATNFVVPLAGVTKVGFLVETNGAGACQAVLGDCMVVEPVIKTVSVTAPQFNGSAAGLTNVAEGIIYFETLGIDTYGRLTVASAGPTPAFWETGLSAAGGSTCHARINVPSWVTNATYTMQVQASGVSTWTNLIEPRYSTISGRITESAGTMWTSNEVVSITAANAVSNFTFSVRFPATNAPKYFGFKATVATNTSATRYFGPSISYRYQ